MGYYDRFNKGGKKPKHQRSEKQKWVDKLDRLMSVYIRMRDSRVCVRIINTDCQCAENIRKKEFFTTQNFTMAAVTRLM